MSYAHAYTTSTGVALNGNWGPGLNGYAKDRLGWMPKSAIYRFGASGEKKAILSLAVSHSRIEFELLVRGGHACLGVVTAVHFGNACSIINC